MMKSLKSILFSFILFWAVGALAEGSAQGINIIVDLEIKMTTKIKGLVSTVDPDALVATKVSLKSANTELVGVPVSAIGMFGSQENQTVEEVDIEKIDVAIYTSMEKLPDPVIKIVEEAVLATSKKAKVQFMPMDPTMKAAIVTRKTSENAQAESMKKIADLSEAAVGAVQKLAKQLVVWLSFGLLVFVITWGIMQMLVSVPSRKAYGKMLNQLGDKIASSQGSATVVAAPSRDNNKGASAASDSSPATSSEAASAAPKDFSIEEEFFKQMSNDSIAMLISECYWCEKDNYAAWVWSKLLPMRRLEMLSKWPLLNAYSSYIGRLTPKWERYHTDGAYLKPIPNLMISNADLKEMLRAQPMAWPVLSVMRKQSVAVSLQERMELSKFKDPSYVVNWTLKESAPRVLPLQIEITHLTIEDEENLLKNPSMISDEMKRQLHTLVWVALIPKDEREKLLAKVPAQGLAEAWTGPEEVLEKIKEVLPDKKKELVSEYVKQTSPDRGSDWFKELSTEALAIWLKANGQAIAGSVESQAA